MLKTVYTFRPKWGNKCDDKYVVWVKYHVLYRQSRCLVTYGQECMYTPRITIWSIAVQTATRTYIRFHSFILNVGIQTLQKTMFRTQLLCKLLSSAFHAFNILIMFRASFCEITCSSLLYVDNSQRIEIFNFPSLCSQGEIFKCPPSILLVFGYVLEDRKITNVFFFYFGRFGYLGGGGETTPQNSNLWTLYHIKN